MSFFVAAYLALWIGLFGYLIWLAGRIRALREEARALAREARAEHGEPGATPPPSLNPPAPG